MVRMAARPVAPSQQSSTAPASMRTSAGRFLLCLVIAGGGVLHAQTAPPATPAPQGAPAIADPPGQPVTVVFVTRPIAVLRARVLGREPAERAETARRAF